MSNSAMSETEAAEVTPNTVDDNLTFADLGLDDRLLRGLAKLNFTKPTPVQAKSIPLALAGKDILAKARTGSGKTAAFMLPLIHKILAVKDVCSVVAAVVLSCLLFCDGMACFES